MSNEIQPIKKPIPSCCHSLKCKNPNSIEARAFNEGAKKQLEVIQEKYVLIPRWKDGKPIE